MAKLDRSGVLELLKGGLAKVLPGFESRHEQEEMTGNVVDAFNNEEIALIEAGTGTGKSLAYLIPAAIKALHHQERVLISTRTINLQEQLIEKDIPLLKKLLGSNFQAVLIKGMGNYLCKRKFEDTRDFIESLPDIERDQMRRIAAWSEQTVEGSKSELSFQPYSAVWESVNCENDSCTYRKCPHYKECHFFNAREKASSAQVMVVNHHLLFADLSFRTETDNWDDVALLPNYKHVIIDEAHHIEDIATELLAMRTSRTELLKTMGKLGSDKTGRVPLLKAKLVHFHGKIPQDQVDPLVAMFSVDLPYKRREVLSALATFFEGVVFFFNSFQRQKEETKFRLLEKHFEGSHWKQEVAESAGLLLQTIREYVHGLKSLVRGLKEIEFPPFQEQTAGLIKEVEAYTKRLDESGQAIQKFVFEPLNVKSVRWLENHEKGTLQNTHLIDAKLDIAPHLAASLFSKFKTIILCSATMTSENSFSFLRDRLGINQSNRSVKEAIYTSPFDYANQCLLVVPKGISDPSSPDFMKQASRSIVEAIQASRGGAFVLFTSYSMMIECYKLVEKKLLSERFALFKQGDEQRQVLLNKFRGENRAVLFATDSFWEGVDVAGDDLKLVILVKLPFKVPTEPIVEGRSELLRTEGKDPFRHFSLPGAVVKFKQGFGRLIRHRDDHGVVLVLDNRLVKKGYGKKFLKSLPTVAVVESDDVKEVVETFFKRKYHENHRSRETCPLP